MSKIIIKDLQINYEEYKGHKKDVILLHGWGQNLQMMDPIAQFLKDHFNVYNIDCPGFGLSDEPKEPIGVDEYVEIIREFVLKKKIENPIFVCHSFGCRIALKYAALYETRKLALTGPAGIRDDRGIEWYVKTYSYKIAKKLISISPFKKDLEKFQNKAGSEDYKNASGVMRGTFVKVVNDDVTPLLKDIDVETLLIVGENDEATPVSKGKKMEELMPNCTMVIFENDDHWAYYHQIYRFNKVLEAFLGDEYD